MYELKSCPFCKNKDVEVIDTYNLEKGLGKAVICNYLKGGCGAMGGSRLTEKEAVEIWNKRE